MIGSPWIITEVEGWQAIEFLDQDPVEAVEAVDCLRPDFFSGRCHQRAEPACDQAHDQP